MKQGPLYEFQEDTSNLPLEEKLFMNKKTHFASLIDI